MKGITTIILAGGKSSRMGTDKGLIKINDKPMVLHVIDEMKQLSSNIIIITNNRSYQQFKLPIYKDLIRDKGPMGGIYTGLMYSNTENNICISCDTPYVNSRLFHYLIKHRRSPVTIPLYENKIHPLLGIYSKANIPQLKNNLDKNQLRLKTFIHSTEYDIVKISPKDFPSFIFYNINSKDDLKQLTKWKQQ